MTTFSKRLFKSCVVFITCVSLLACKEYAQTAATEKENEAAAPLTDASGVLVFSKTSGYYHESIPDGIAAIQKLGSENGFQVDTTKDASKLPN